MTLLMQPVQSHLLSTDVQRAAQCLSQGGLVAFPTETVYGLGADASNPEALRRLYAVKGRPTHHPVIVHLAGADQLPRWAREIPPAAWRLAEACWPGPLTMILKRALHVPDAVTGGQDTVGIRVPSHPLALELLRAFGGGIAAPSANRFGRVSPTTAQHVVSDLGDDVDLILDGGPCPVGVESTIIDLTGEVPVLLRPGMMEMAELARILGTEVRLPQPHEPTTRTPGTLKSHYSPATPVQLVAPEALEETVTQLRHSGVTVAVLATRPAPPSLHDVPWVFAAEDPREYARTLYTHLRMLDAMGCQRLVVQQVPREGLWQAVSDRLQRAARWPDELRGERT